MTRHSTATALLSLTDQIRHGMNHSQITLLALIDPSRWLDAVDHVTLQTVSTMTDYHGLAGHTQRVRVSDTLSEPRAIDISTFQGTCLGPLLFNVVSNSISCYIPSGINGFSAFSVRYADTLRWPYLVHVAGCQNWEASAWEPAGHAVHLVLPAWHEGQRRQNRASCVRWQAAGGPNCEPRRIELMGELLPLSKTVITV